jgi:phospholipid-binding lipoprotein MlaA
MAGSGGSRGSDVVGGIVTKSFDRQTLRRPGRRAVSALALLVLAACARGEPGAEINDPYEAANRRTHAFNLALDKALFGNSEQKGAIPRIPVPITIGFSNFSANLGMPSNILNSLLQAKPGPALQNTFRFAINTTVGVGGIFDPAGAIGIDADPADFGETLHVWGVPQGAYLEVPVWGPSTERDWAGTVVDLAINPINTVLQWPESGYATVVILTGKAGNRQRFADTYESILYESADSYAQARLLYLQNRDFDLGIEEDVIDPYEDPYVE